MMKAVVVVVAYCKNIFPAHQSLTKDKSLKLNLMDLNQMSEQLKSIVEPESSSG